MNQILKSDRDAFRSSIKVPNNDGHIETNAQRALASQGSNKKGTGESEDGSRMRTKGCERSR